ncbi:MAG: hypothetical protein ABI333_16205 [bacterium]
MKKIEPLRLYQADRGYPATSEVRRSKRADRRGFLKAFAAGAVVVAGELLYQSKAQAQPKLPPPGTPPLPRKKPRPGIGAGSTVDRSRIPGGGPMPTPTPTPKPTSRPCNTTDPVAVTLEPPYRFCSGVTGKLVVWSVNPQVVALLRKPGEGKRLAPMILPVLSKEMSCAWLEDQKQVARVTAVLSQVLTDGYAQLLGIAVTPLKVGLVASGRKHTPLYPDRVNLPLPPGVPRRPRHRRGGCASCSTGAALEDVLVPAGLVALALAWLKNRTG